MSTPATTAAKLPTPSPAAKRSLPPMLEGIAAGGAIIAASLAFATLSIEHALVGAPFAAVLVLVAIIDLREGLIPNRVILPATAVLFLAQVALFPAETSEWVLAAVVAALVLAIPHALRGSWMGMGDVKLALLLGVVLGWAAIGAIVLAFLCVFPVALIVLLRGGFAARTTTIPFGPFLALGALIVLYGGLP